MTKDLFSTSCTGKRDLTPNSNTLIKPSRELVISNQSGTDLQALDEKVKSMMEKGQRMKSNREKDRNGSPTKQPSYICKVCGKEGRSKDIRDHIESNHLEGISIACDYCGNTLSSRNSLRLHKTRFHK